MKKYQPIIIATLALALTIPVITHAEDSVSAESDTSVSTRTTAPHPLPNIIREKLRAANQVKIQNGNTEGDAEARIHEQRSMATSTRHMIKDVRSEIKEVRSGMKEMRSDAKDMMRNSSTTMMEKRATRTAIRLEVFKAEKEKLIKQLELTISNLNQIRARIVSRIEKIQSSGTDVTEPNRLLAIADTKFTAAKTAVDAITSYEPTTSGSSDASTTLSADIKLEKPRALGRDAIQATKDVREALTAVIRAIAHSMGSNTTASTTIRTDSEN